MCYNDPAVRKKWHMVFFLFSKLKYKKLKSVSKLSLQLKLPNF